MRRRFHARAIVAVVATMTMGASCSVDDGASRSDEPPESVAPTTLPAGTPAELLPRLVTTLQAVAEAIIDDADQVALLAEAEALWAASEPEVAAEDTTSAEEMEGMMDLARRAVERRRPADADKAAKFLDLLVDHYLSQ